MSYVWTNEKPTVPITRETKSIDQVLARIMRKIEPVTESGCWIWTGATKGNEEYGRVYIGERAYQAHRLLYEILRGVIPHGLVLDHICRVRICVNPDHLEVVTDRINILRGKAPGIVRMTSLTCIHGHAWDQDNTRWYKGRKFCRSCERERSHGRRHALTHGQWAGPIAEPKEA